MTKADVMAKLEEYKGRPIEIGLSDEGAMLYAGIEGHWLFVQGDNLVEVKKNSSDGTSGFSTVNQNQRPFTVTVVPFDIVNYVRTHIKNEPGDIQKIITDMEPVGVDKTLDEVIKEIESIDDYEAAAVFCRDNVKPMFDGIRMHGDRLETLVGRENWPLPSYEQMLFKQS